MGRVIVFKIVFAIITLTLLAFQYVIWKKIASRFTDDKTLRRLRVVYWLFVGAGQSTEVMVRWELTLYTKQTGKRAILNGIGLFKFKPITPGVKLQLESVREFWDPVELMSQLQ